jgi:glutaredoxin-related protein
VPRSFLPEIGIHPAIRDKISRAGAEIIAEVEAAIAANEIVVVGMKQNPVPKRARRMLDAAGLAYKYLEYGSYFGQYRKRLPLKLWTGWTTFPMIFVKGVFVGGADDLGKLLASGELKGKR